MEILAIIFLCLAASYILSQLLEGIKLPRVLGSIIVGLIFGIPFIKNIVFNQETLMSLKTFADLGLIFLMFYVGLEIDFKDFKKTSKPSMWVAFLSALFPLVIGFTVCYYLGLGIFVSLMIGAALSVTAEAVSIDILTELNAMRTKVGEIVIGAGILDDIIEIILITGVVTYIHSLQRPEFGVLIVIIDLILFFVLVYLIRFLILPFVLRSVSLSKSKTTLFLVSLIVATFMASLSTYLQLGGIIGALLGGMLIRHVLIKTGEEGKKEEETITELIEVVTFSFFAPFFFIWIGINTDITRIIADPMLGILLTCIAVVGKIVGSILGNWIARGTLIEGMTIGWGMNSRGEVELVVAELARDSGLINTDLFSALIFMAVVTTFLSPLLFKWLLHKYHLEKQMA